MSEGGSQLVAGKSFPWEYITGGCLRVQSFLPFAKIDGENVGPAIGGAYGLVTAELPNPDVSLEQRVFIVPIEHESDYKSVSRAHIDTGVKSGANELVIVYEHRRGWFGGKKACLHVAAFPAGTWKAFFDAVTNYKAQEFRWPNALFLYQPGDIQVFAASANIFSP